MPSFLQSLIDFIFPPRIRTLHAREIIDRETLDSSAGALPDANIHALLSYRDPQARILIRALKYDNDVKSIRYCAELVFEWLTEYESDRKALGINDKLLITCIPPRKDRMKTLGFSQGDILLKQIKKLDRTVMFEFNARLLGRTKQVASQTSLKHRAERLQNMKNVFQANDNARNRDVIVIDDVMTTGATFNDAMRALVHAGARSVACLAIAH